MVYHIDSELAEVVLAAVEQWNKTAMELGHLSPARIIQCHVRCRFSGCCDSVSPEEIVEFRSDKWRVFSFDPEWILPR